MSRWSVGFLISLLAGGMLSFYLPQLAMLFLVLAIICALEDCKTQSSTKVKT